MPRAPHLFSTGLDDAQLQVTSYEERIKKLEQTLDIEKIKKAEAINKLTQVSDETLVNGSVYF